MSFSTLNTPTSLSLADAEQIRGTARWARTIAIIGFVFLGLMLCFALFFGTMFSRMMSMSAGMSGQSMPFDPSIFGAMYTVVFVIMVLIYFFPTLFLYRYATRTLKAFGPTFDGAQFSAGLAAHRSFYSYVGVLMIIMAVLYGIGFLFALIGGIFAGAMASGM